MDSEFQARLDPLCFWKLINSKSTLQIQAVILSVFVQAVHVLDRQHKSTHFYCLIPLLDSFKANSLLLYHLILVTALSKWILRYSAWTDEETNVKQLAKSPYLEQEHSSVATHLFLPSSQILPLPIFY